MVGTVHVARAVHERKKGHIVDANDFVDSPITANRKRLGHGPSMYSTLGPMNTFFARGKHLPFLNGTDFATDPFVVKPPGATMSLDKYRRPRLVILHPRSSAREAARAMADNHIGAVLVTDDHELVGIVTDRDIALDVVAAELDPHTTTVRDVMSDEMACVDIDDNVSDVLDTMRTQGCRRVPVMSDGRPVGIITLDDLILDDAINLNEASSVIAAQLEVAARFKAEGETFPSAPAKAPDDRRSRARQRRNARAENTYGRLLRAIERHTGLDSRDRAEQALRLVLSNVCRRLTPNEAEHLMAQLPSKLALTLERPYEGPNRSITTDTIQHDLRQTLHLIPDDAADVLYSICDVIADSVSAGEIESVRAELPATMKDLFPAMPFRRAG